MDIFSNLEILKLSACGITFMVGVIVCINVLIRDTKELRQRRQAKRLIHEDELRRNLARRHAQARQVQTVDIQPSYPVPKKPESFA